MKRIDHATATVDDEFTEGNPGTGTPATRVTAQWLNVMQEEIAHVVEQAGDTLDQTGVDRTQLYTAIMTLIADAADLGYEAGTITFVGKNAPDTGNLECNGAAVSRTTYAALFAKIGTTFGAGNGTTTFNLPDIRGEFVRGWDNARGIDSGRAIGSAQAATLVRWAPGVLGTGQHTVAAASGADGLVSNTYNSPAAAAQTSATTNDFYVRPRNVALLAQIKY